MGIGFWIVIGMLMLALVAVMAAIAAEDRGDDRQHRSPPIRPVRWLALEIGRPATPNLGQDWATLLAASIGASAEARIVSIDAERFADARAPALQAVDAWQPDTLAFWCAASDLLAGVSLTEHEPSLAEFLEALEARGVTAVLGNVPNLSRIGAPPFDEMPPAELAHLTERWNVAFQRLAANHHARVVDLTDVPAEVAVDDEWCGRGVPDGPWAFAQAEVAERFLPVQRAVIDQCRERLARDAAVETL
jgi:hypothetical protein